MVSRLRLIGRFSLYLLLTGAVAVLGAMALIQAQQRILQRRAESLLQDIQSLELRQASFAQAELLRRKWRKWEINNPVDACTAERCDIEIVLRDLSYRPWAPGSVALALYRAYQMAGGRGAEIRATVTVRNDRVWGKGFALSLHAVNQFPNGQIAGDARRGWARSAPRVGFIDLRHPDYEVGIGVPPFIFVSFSPFAPNADVKELMKFNLGCLEPYYQCRQLSDLMPEAWRRLQADGPGSFEAHKLRACRDVLELVGRDSTSAAIVSVLRNQPFADQAGARTRLFHAIALRLDERLKRISFWEPGTTKSVMVMPQSFPVFSHAAVGSRWILLLRRAHLDSPSDFDACSPVPLNEDNLALVRRGIVNDDRPDDIAEPQ
jgi:hypothetical protein